MWGGVKFNVSLFSFYLLQMNYFQFSLKKNIKLIKIQKSTNFMTESKFYGL